MGSEDEVWKWNHRCRSVQALADVYIAGFNTLVNKHGPGNAGLLLDARAILSEVRQAHAKIKTVMLYEHFKADGWPLCPRCGEDELYSLEMPRASVETIVGCYRCQWKPEA